MNDKIKTFLQRHGFSLAAINANEILANFAFEMKLGLSGATSSLAMIPSYISLGSQIPTGENVIVLDAGGTNLRVCLVKFNEEGKAEISHFSKYKMPGTEKLVSKDEFFQTLSSYVTPLLQFAKNIGFCFSYPAEITPDCDGRLIRWTKQIKAPEVEGLLVGAELRKYLPTFTGKIAVLNDTVATLLAGVNPQNCYSSYVGFILGTGTNTATSINNKLISKCQSLTKGSMIVNIESGMFSKVALTDFDEALHARTADPHFYNFEKMISGAYLGELGLCALQSLAHEDLLSPEASSAISVLKALPNKDFDDFCASPLTDTGILSTLPLTDDDRRAIQAVGEAIYTRAAILSAINLAAAVILSEGGKDPLRPVLINIDGSTYYRTRTAELKSRVEENLRTILEPLGLHYRTICVDDSPVIGAAVAGLTI